MILVYVAGPFGAPSDDEIEENIRRAESVAREVISRSEKFSIIVPHSLGRTFMHGPGTPDYWYDSTLKMAKQCDVILTVPGWEKSKGARVEVGWFIGHKLAVYHSANELIEAFK